jgi:hypothetical protein
MFGILSFWRLKATKKQPLRDLALGRDPDHRTRIFLAYAKAATRLTMRYSSEKVGLGFEQRVETTQ